MIGEEIMKCGAQVALAVAGGYVLGRRKKTRLALMLGGAALTGRLNGAAGQLMRSGTKLLGSSDVLSKAAPGLGEVGGIVKDDLAPAAKRASATAISAQIESLSDQLRTRADAIREESTGRAGRAAETDENEPPDEGESEDDGEDQPAQRRQVSGRRQRDAGNGHAESRSDESGETEDEEPAERAPRNGARSGRSAHASSPIRRTQR